MSRQEALAMLATALATVLATTSATAMVARTSLKQAQQTTSLTAKFLSRSVMKSIYQFQEGKGYGVKLIKCRIGV